MSRLKHDGYWCIYLKPCKPIGLHLFGFLWNRLNIRQKNNPKALIDHFVDVYGFYDKEVVLSWQREMFKNYVTDW